MPNTEGETVTYDGARLVVETTENNRILEVRIELPTTGTPASDSPDGE